MANAQTDKYGTPPDDKGNGGAAQGTPTHVNLPPIGVPWTVDASGAIVPYTATVSGTTSEDDLRYQGGRPGTHQIQQAVTKQVPAQYFSGDEFAPASWPPEQISAYQAQLVKAGLLRAGSYQAGVWDSQTVSAYTQLLGGANAAGMTKEDMLARWSQQAATSPGAGAGPLTVRLSNPEDLAAVFRKAVVDTLGEGWDSGKINQMVQSYQAIQASTQTQDHNLALSGGTVTGAPSPQEFAVQQARQQNPLGAQEHDVIAQGGPLDSFRQMLAGWQ